MIGDNMKKFAMLLVITLLVCGCEKKEKYDYTCVKEFKDLPYKKSETLEFSFDSAKVYKFYSVISETHENDDTLNGEYTSFQNLYDNYNENNVEASYKKEDKNITATYFLDKSDIDNMKIYLPYNFKLSENGFVELIKNSSYKCKKN